MHNDLCVFLECEFYSELQLARIECASRLAEEGIVQAVHVCPAQLEIGVIENVERFCAELQAEPVGEPEILEDRSVHCPVTRSDKGVAA